MANQQDRPYTSDRQAHVCFCCWLLPAARPYHGQCQRYNAPGAKQSKAEQHGKGMFRPPAYYYLNHGSTLLCAFCPLLGTTPLPFLPMAPSPQDRSPAASSLKTEALAFSRQALAAGPAGAALASEPASLSLVRNLLAAALPCAGDRYYKVQQHNVKWDLMPFYEMQHCSMRGDCPTKVSNTVGQGRGNASGCWRSSRCCC
jgi:hypothetical protein